MDGRAARQVTTLRDPWWMTTCLGIREREKGLAKGQQVIGKVDER
jgi:hypothetical protein